MAYRSPAHACHRCDDEAHSICAHCETPRCLEHTVTQGVRCLECEHAFLARLESVGAWRWRVLGFALAAPLMPLMTGPLQQGWRERMWVWGALPTGLAYFDAAIVTLLTGMALGHALLFWRKLEEERRFQLG